MNRFKKLWQTALLCACVVVIAVSKNTTSHSQPEREASENERQREETVKPSEEGERTDDMPEETTEETTEERIARLRNILPGVASLDIQPILQNPELPTGCESVSLTMALEFLGFELEKTTIADQYLIRSTTNFAEGYVGDPYSDHGAGIFPPGLTETANGFLKVHDSGMSAYDITGVEFEELYSYIAAGYPVLIWSTMYYDEPQFAGAFSTAGDRTYEWYNNEHCIVLGGYDLTQNTAILFDPLRDTQVMEIPDMKYLYDAVGKYAVVIY
ncbi:C39 family peptidase [Ruminococcus sp. OA3]|uniref:C39 family peptidase n=1 Tax=Ruminococcus sp. OA3 TaxID=2914164 RepID=UPI001F067CEA|nr:C39 family peptidase [Ruminococcus sp. OA3]MCH1983270.1 C39 family peptidase [Ruminococcus sp. OA3]